MSPQAPLAELSRAKINLTLRVRGRRADGYHEIESLVVFADLHDRLELTAGEKLSLSVDGEFAKSCGAPAGNLVLKAANTLASQAAGLTLGRFALTKNLPVAAGLGGGSADAAAALRLLARANGLSLDDPRLIAAARAIGADVPVCLDPRPRVMRGIGEKLSAPLPLPKLSALLVNPGIAVPTAEVFAAYAKSGQAPSPADPAIARIESGGAIARSALIEALNSSGNDLEAPATALHPAIGQLLAELRALPGCALTRMSGSGATCFALLDDTRAAAAALTKSHPAWWIKEATLSD